jgi:hypothetical protein
MGIFDRRGVPPIFAYVTSPQYTCANFDINHSGKQPYTTLIKRVEYAKFN